MANRSAMLVNLQLLRFLAAATVVAYHVAPHAWASGAPRGGLLDFVQLFAFGGVDVFFVISGFIMWHTTHDDRGPGAAWRFLRRRAARIYSGYWPFLLLTALLWYLYHPDLIPQKNWPLSATLLTNPLGTTAQLDPGGLALPVSWTLLYELYFYIAFGVFIALRRGRGLRTIFAGLAVIILVSIYAQLSGLYTPERLIGSSIVFTLYLSPFCAQFLLGSLIAEWYERRAIKWPGLWLLIGVGFLGLIAWVNARWYQGNLLLGYYTPTRVLLFSGAACAFVLWAVGLDRKDRVFIPRVSLILGGSSYALYLSHTLWLQWLFDVGVRGWLAERGLTVAGYWLAAIAVVVMSALFYEYAERPLHRLFRRLLGVGRPR